MCPNIQHNCMAVIDVNCPVGGAACRLWPDKPTTVQLIWIQGKKTVSRPCKCRDQPSHNGASAKNSMTFGLLISYSCISQSLWKFKLYYIQLDIFKLKAGECRHVQLFRAHRCLLKVGSWTWCGLSRGCFQTTKTIAPPFVGDTIAFIHILYNDSPKMDALPIDAYIHIKYALKTS